MPYVLLQSKRPVDEAPCVIERENIDDEIRNKSKIKFMPIHDFVCLEKPATVIKKLEKLGYFNLGFTGDDVCGAWILIKGDDIVYGDEKSKKEDDDESQKDDADDLNEDNEDDLNEDNEDDCSDVDNVDESSTADDQVHNSAEDDAAELGSDEDGLDEGPSEEDYVQSEEEEEDNEEYAEVESYDQEDFDLSESRVPLRGLSSDEEDQSSDGDIYELHTSDEEDHQSEEDKELQQSSDEEVQLNEREVEEEDHQSEEDKELQQSSDEEVQLNERDTEEEDHQNKDVEPECSDGVQLDESKLEEDHQNDPELTIKAVKTKLPEHAHQVELGEENVHQVAQEDASQRPSLEEYATKRGDTCDLESSLEHDATFEEDELGERICYRKEKKISLSAYVRKAPSPSSENVSVQNQVNPYPILRLENLLAVKEEIDESPKEKEQDDSPQELQLPELENESVSEQNEVFLHSNHTNLVVVKEKLQRQKVAEQEQGESPEEKSSEEPQVEEVKLQPQEESIEDKITRKITGKIRKYYEKYEKEHSASLLDPISTETPSSSNSQAKSKTKKRSADDANSRVTRSFIGEPATVNVSRNTRGRSRSHQPGEVGVGGEFLADDKPTSSKTLSPSTSSEDFTIAESVVCGIADSSEDSDVPFVEVKNVQNRKKTNKQSLPPPRLASSKSTVSPTFKDSDPKEVKKSKRSTKRKTSERMSISSGSMVLASTTSEDNAPTEVKKSKGSTKRKADSASPSTQLEEVDMGTLHTGVGTFKLVKYESERSRSKALEKFRGLMKRKACQEPKAQGGEILAKRPGIDQVLNSMYNGRIVMQGVFPPGLTPEQVKKAKQSTRKRRQESQSSQELTATNTLIAHSAAFQSSDLPLKEVKKCKQSTSSPELPKIRTSDLGLLIAAADKHLANMKQPNCSSGGGTNTLAGPSTTSESVQEEVLWLRTLSNTLANNQRSTSGNETSPVASSNPESQSSRGERDLQGMKEEKTIKKEKL